MSAVFYLLQNRILIAVDGSEHRQVVLDYLGTFPSVSVSDCLLVHVVPPVTAYEPETIP